MSIGGSGCANSCCSSLVLFSSRVVVRLLHKATNTTTRGGGYQQQQQQQLRRSASAAAALSGGTSFTRDEREKKKEENSGGNLYFRRRRRCLRRSGGGAFCRSLSSRGEDTGNNNNNNNMGSVVPKNFTVAKSRRNNGEEVRYEHKQRNTDTRKLKAWLEERGINSSETFGSSSSSSSSSSNEEKKERGDDPKIGLKSIEDLLKEIENGETVLIENTIKGDDGTTKLSCVRRVSVVVVEITSKSKPNKKLIEYEQTLPSGATRRRERFLSEKIMSGKGETPLEAAKRGIREELGNALDANAVVSIDETSLRSKEEDCSSSQSYRDLPTRYRFYEVKAEIEGLPVDSDAFTSVETCGTKAVWKWV